MRIKLLFFMLIASITIIGCVENEDNPIDIVTVMDDAFKKYLVDNFDTDKDGEISAKEANAVKEINCSRMVIGSIEGIENFTSLEKLNVSYNQWLKVVDISKNANLVEFNCDGCENLNTFDITNNQKLRTLICKGTSMLSLDISQSKIEYLDCNYSYLLSLNASGCESLKTLYCKGGYLQTIDASNSGIDIIDCSNSSLKYLNLKNCRSLKVFEYEANNGEVALDLSGCTALTKIVASGLYSINLSGCSNLIELKINSSINELNIDECTKLKEFNYRGTLSTIDFSNNTQLERITLNTTIGKLNSLDVSMLENLKYLNCINLNMDLDLSSNINLEEAYLYGFDYYDVTSNLLKIENLPLLKKLECYGSFASEINAENCIALEEILCEAPRYNNSMLKVLNVSGCTSLKKLICKDTELTTLDTHECTSLDTLILINAIGIADLKISENVSYLECQSAKIDKLDLSNYSKLEKVLWYGFETSEIILDGCHLLKYLDVSYNNLITTLNLEHCPLLQELHCDINKLADLSLGNCKSLETLSCRGNDLSLLDLSLCRSMKNLNCKENASLAKLVLYKNHTINIEKDAYTIIELVN